MTLCAGRAASGLDAAVPVGRYFNNVFPPTAPGSAGGWTVVDAFPNLSFIDPVKMVSAPRSDKLFVLGKDGYVWSFVNNSTTATKTLVMDIRTRVQSTDNAGLTGLTFHPEFGLSGSANSRYFYVMYYYTPTPLYLPGTDSTADTDIVGEGDETINHTCIRLSRFTMNVDGVTADQASEFVYLQEFDRQAWHNGCSLCFGPDGFLYFAIGDEGLDSDYYKSMQKFNERLFGGVFRIDIDYTPGSTRSHAIRRQPVFTSVAPVTPCPGNAPHPDTSKLQPHASLGTNHTYSQGYGIPNTNPWQDPAGLMLEEYYAIGVRSPHTMTCDPVTGELWLGDVGQASWEEVNKIVSGGDYQWPYREGNVVFTDADWCRGTLSKTHSLVSTQVPPVVAYDHEATGGSAVIGGYVYRGREHAAALYGKYLFTDHGNPTVAHIWALSPGSSTPTLLTDMTAGGFHWNVAAWGRDADGELYLIRLGRASGADGNNAFIPPVNAAGAWITKVENGKIFKLARTTTNVPEPPALLSNVGALAPFTATSGLTPNAAFIPYTPAAPFWSDAAAKSRWVAIPNDGTPDAVTGFVGYSTTAEWTFPAGTVFMKHFDIGLSEVNPLLTRRLETRFMVKGPTEWYGLTYRWRADQTEADLLYTADTAALTIATAAGSRNQTWSFPSRSECLTCHTALAGGALGFKIHQLNNRQFYPITGRTENQLETLSALGFLSPAPTQVDIAAAPRAPSPTDVTAPLETRVKAYLDSNCATCHRPAGANANWDGRFGTAMTASGILYGSLKKVYGASGNVVVRPFDPNASILYLRSHLLGGTGNLTQMPPLGKSLLDVAGEQLLFDWISVAGLDGKYFSNTALTGSAALARSDAQLNFIWTGTPGSPVAADNFSARWTGRIFGNQTGNHTIYVNADGGIRLYVRGQLVIDRWTNSAAAVESNAVVSLAAGKYTDFVLEKYSTTGTSTAELRWAGTGITKALIPSANLTAMPVGETRPLAVADTFTVQRGLATTITPVANDTDAQGALNPSAVAVLTPPTSGTLTIDTMGAVVYTNNGSAAATDTASYVVSDAAGNTSLPASITLNVIARHVAWRNATFTTLELADPSFSGWDQDPDHDGVNNLLEWALNGDPKNNASQPRPTYTTVSTPGGPVLRCSVAKRLTNDTLLGAETSTDMTTWNPSDPNVQLIEDSAQNFIVQIPKPASGPLFLRVRVSLPAP